MRLFIAIELTDTVRSAAASVAVRLRERLERSAPDLVARWAEPENYHITVWFIGDVTDAKAVTIAESLGALAGGGAFDVALRGCGAFPHSGVPRVFWIGVDEGLSELRQLYRRVGRVLEPLGFTPEGREYSAHLTLARVKDAGRAAPRMIRSIVTDTPGDCGLSPVAALTLLRSRLSPRGSTYEPLLRVPLS